MIYAIINRIENLIFEIFVLSVRLNPLSNIVNILRAFRCISPTLLFFYKMGYKIIQYTCQFITH